MDKNIEPSACPDCGCEDITADYPDQNGNSLDRIVVCEGCGYRWIESFTFHEWEALEDILEKEE